MKFSCNWLKSFVTPSNNLTEDLTQLGLEVAQHTPISTNSFKKIVVAEIIKISPITHSKKLNKCSVNIDPNQPPIQIVCGASNAREGLKTACALTGAEVSGLKIQPTSLQGVESFGMLCSASELGLPPTKDKEGILELNSNAPAGTPLDQYLDLNDHVIEIELTPDRGDCLSLTGIARDLATLYQTTSKPTNIHQACTEKLKLPFDIHIKNPSLCPSYHLALIKNIPTNIETPDDIKQKLIRSGFDPINCIVDITNYIQLQLGQPIHAFDFNKIKGPITVRNAKPKEEITLLNQNTLSLKEDTLLIADTSGPIAIAGIMGNLHTSIQESPSEETIDILIESAFFNPKCILNRARNYNIQTESSFRFERGVDFTLPEKALQLAIQLITEIIGGTPEGVLQRINTENLPSRLPLELSAQSIQKYMGFLPSSDKITKNFKSLGFTIHNKNQEIWTITPPPHRFDIETTADLIGEICRIEGFNSIPNIPYQSKTSKFIQTNEKHALQMRAKNYLTTQGYHEIISYSFISAEEESFFSEETQQIHLKNPMSKEQSVMRSSLLPGLIKTAKFNQTHQHSNIQLFELGQCFTLDNDKPHEKLYISGLLTGDRHDKQWSQKSVKFDFFDLKEHVEKLLHLLHIEHTQITGNETTHYLHSGQAATIYHNDTPIGLFGRLHPRLEKHFKLPSATYCFEINLNKTKGKKRPHFKPFSPYPSMKRDISCLLSKNITAEDLISSIQSLNIDILKSQKIVDMYAHKELGKNKKSLSIQLEFNSSQQTLTDAQVEISMTTIIQALTDQYQAILR